MPVETPEVTVAPPTVAWLGYLAGIMDGEGYFQGSPGTHSFGLRVAMIDRCVIDWLHETFSGWTSHGGRTSVGNQVHVWALQRKADLRYLLPLLVPHLVLKRGQALAMLDLIAHLDARPGGYEVPTAMVTKAERDRRRALMACWVEKRIERREALKNARHAVSAK